MVQCLATGKDDPWLIYGKEHYFKAQKRPVLLHYFNINDYFIEDVTIKTLEGVAHATINDKLIIGVKNEVWPIATDEFNKKYQSVEMDSVYLADEQMDDILIKSDSQIYRITKDNIGKCPVCFAIATIVDVVQLIDQVKVQTRWGEFLAKCGDYLLINSFDDYYICDAEIFDITYRKLESRKLD